MAESETSMEYGWPTLVAESKVGRREDIGEMIQQFSLDSPKVNLKSEASFLSNDEIRRKIQTSGPTTAQTPPSIPKT